MDEDSKTAEFLEAINAPDRLGVVIRGHLYIESELIQLIEALLPDPGAIDLTRLNFPLKGDLAVALGALSEEEKRGLLALNSLRNKLAHNAKADITDADETHLRKQLDAKTRLMVDKMVKSTFFTVPAQTVLRFCITALHITLSAKREIQQGEKAS